MHGTNVKIYLNVFILSAQNGNHIPLLHTCTTTGQLYLTAATGPEH